MTGVQKKASSARPEGGSGSQVQFSGSFSSEHVHESAPLEETTRLETTYQRAQRGSPTASVQAECLPPTIRALDATLTPGPDGKNIPVMDVLDTRSSGHGNDPPATSTASAAAAPGYCRSLTAYDVFMSFVRYTSSGEVDVSKVFSTECFKLWLKTRANVIKFPEQTFYRTFISQLRSKDSRRPFPEEVEAAMLVRLRDTAENVWDRMFPGNKLNIGRYGFKHKGHHEERKENQRQKEEREKKDPMMSLSSSATTIEPNICEGESIRRKRNCDDSDSISEDLSSSESSSPENGGRGEKRVKVFSTRALAEQKPHSVQTACQGIQIGSFYLPNTSNSYEPATCAQAPMMPYHIYPLSQIYQAMSPNETPRQASIQIHNGLDALQASECELHNRNESAFLVRHINHRPLSEMIKDFDESAGARRIRKCVYYDNFLMNITSDQDIGKPLEESDLLLYRSVQELITRILLPLFKVTQTRELTRQVWLRRRRQSEANSSFAVFLIKAEFDPSSLALHLWFQGLQD